MPQNSSRQKPSDSPTRRFRAQVGAQGGGLDAGAAVAQASPVPARSHRILHIDLTLPWADTITTAHTRLTALAVS